MGKNQRHKKILKSEKSKIKLKAGAKTKFLPKGANVTDTNFKVKPILLLQQLKSHKIDEPLTKKKLNFKDLVTRLNHHNISAKCEACEGLIELVKSSPESVLEVHLYSVVHGVCKLVLNVEKKARQKAIKLISDLMGKVSAFKLSPFFDILTSYASCAMTHIDKNVQEDSLLLIDAYLRHTPLLIIKSFDKILNNFLTLISKLRSDSKLSRTLTVNLNSKMTSIKWRTKVLTRLQGILQVIIDEKTHITETQNHKTVHSDEIGHIIPIYKGIQYCPINFLNYISAAEVHTSNKIEQYVEVLVPLLYETWAEVVPLSNVSNMDSGVTVIQQDAASILSCVMGIFHQLWKLLKNSIAKGDENEMKKCFLSKDGQKFVSHLLNQFPYCQQDVHHKQKMTKHAMPPEVNVDPKCVQENLLICYMFCVLYKTFPSLHYLKKAHEVLDYLKTCLVNRNYFLLKNIETLSLTLRIIFFDNSKLWIQKNINVAELLDNLLHFHKKLGEDSYGKIEIFNLLCDVVQLPHLRSQKYELWLSKLPTLLCKPEISTEVIGTLSLLSRQNNGLFLAGLSEELPKILDNLPAIKIKGNDLYPADLKIVNMFYYLPVTQEHIQLLANYVKINEQSKTATYVQDVLLDKRKYLKRF